MSRIGKKPVSVPAGVKVQTSSDAVTLEGPKGKLSVPLTGGITAEHNAETNEISVGRPNDEREAKALHGTYRSLIANHVLGVTTGYKKTLEIQGVGYKAEQKGKALVLSVGFANQITVAIPDDVKVTLEGNNKIHVEGIDKQRVGQFAAAVRATRKPEPYKGKGIRYEGEYVKIKPGKAFGAK
ncbi:MAG: 50S ribosomal protein L6 [Phycisphaerae bacterium]